MANVKANGRKARTTSPAPKGGLPRRALSIRQPWAELILRGKKKIEVRSRATKIRGPLCLYASASRATSDDHCLRSVGCAWEELDRGVIVGIIELTNCRELRKTDARAAGFGVISSADGLYAWEVRSVKRLAKPIAPKKHAQPSFFFPFG